MDTTIQGLGIWVSVKILKLWYQMIVSVFRVKVTGLISIP